MDPLRVLGQKSFQKNDHFLPSHPKMPIFHKNINVFFLKFPNTHIGNTLFIDDTPYKYIFNDSCNAIFLELFKGACSDRDYLLSTMYFKVLKHILEMSSHLRLQIVRPKKLLILNINGLLCYFFHFLVRHGNARMFGKKYRLQQSQSESMS